MPSLVLVDTDVFVDLARGAMQESEFKAQIHRDRLPVVSIVTRMELIQGCRDKAELRNVDRMLLRFQIIGLAADIGDRAAGLLQSYHLSHGLDIPDALIAATSLTERIPLWTRNRRHYRFIEGLDLHVRR